MSHTILISAILESRPHSGLKLTTINVIAGLGNSAHLIVPGTDGVAAAACSNY
jgi:hypothetical protein